MKLLLVSLVTLLTACDGTLSEPDGGEMDSGIEVDGGQSDAGVPDAGTPCDVVFNVGELVHWSEGNLRVRGLTSNPHNLRPGQEFTLEPGEERFPGGVYAVVSTQNQFTVEWSAQPEEFIRTNDVVQCLRVLR